jgi:hypothetical protein
MASPTAQSQLLDRSRPSAHPSVRARVSSADRRCCQTTPRTTALRGVTLLLMLRLLLASVPVAAPELLRRAAGAVAGAYARWPGPFAAAALRTAAFLEREAR